MHLLLASPRSAMQSVSHVHGTPVVLFQKRTLSNILLSFTACGMTSAQFDSTKRHVCPKSLEDSAKLNALLDVTHTHKTAQTSLQDSMLEKIQSCRMHWQCTIYHFAMLDAISHCNFAFRVLCNCDSHRRSLIPNYICKWVSNFLPWEHILCLKEIASTVTIQCNTRWSKAVASRVETNKTLFTLRNQIYTPENLKSDGPGGKVHPGFSLQTHITLTSYQITNIMTVFQR